MRIQILSDLHLEFEGNSIPPAAPEVDVMVLAGDLAPSCTHRVGEVAKRWAGVRHVLYVSGNHEFYGSEINQAQRALARACREYGVTLLDPGAVTIGGIRFIGATLWTDFCLEGGPAGEVWAHLDVGRSLSDFAGAIRLGEGSLSTHETARRHALERAFIEHELALARQSNLPTVVVSHHAPSPRCIQPAFEGNRLNPGFASDLDKVIERFQPLLWIHGHMHSRIEETLGDTRLVANPYGYGPMGGKDFDPELIVDLPSGPVSGPRTAIS